MEFNEYWTKEDNDLLRKFNCEHKSHKFITEYFGKEKLSHHPKNKFGYGKITSSFKQFILSDYKRLLETVIKPKETEYDFYLKKSLSCPNKYDYIINYKVNDHDYVIVLFYLIENDMVSYNVLFSTLDQYNKYSSILKQIIKSGKKELTDEDYSLLSNILENETNYNEVDALMRSTSYIIFDIYEEISPIPLSIGETKNPIKINYYRDLIKKSFDNVKETGKIDSYGNKIYYYNIE